MIDFAEARRMMVDCQVRTMDVTDLRLQAAMLDVPRELFVPVENQALAYLDLDVPVLAGVPEGVFDAGDLGAIGRSRIPMARTRLVKACP